MTKEQLAEKLNGREYITPEECAAAKAAGLVVIFGASDDLMEFRGALYDEAYPGETGVIKIHRGGVLDAHHDCYCNFCGYEAKAGKCATVQALWCKEPGYSWTYKTDLPHAPFEIVEGAGKYCRGIVIEAGALPSI